MSPLLFNVYMDIAVQEVNVRAIGKVLELLSVNGGRFDLNHLLFADDTALVAGSEEKLCRLVSEFGRVCKRRNLSVLSTWGLKCQLMEDVKWMWCSK